MIKQGKKRTTGFTLIELMIVMVIGSIISAGIYTFLGQQRKQANSLRMKADLESLSQIAFFIIGRDIRRAGSNPAGALGYTAGAPLPLAQATANKIEILADLDGDGAITPGTDERIIYEFVDDPDDADAAPDQIRRQAGNQLVIKNVQAFDLSYQLVSGVWDPNPVDPALIRKVRVHLAAGTGRTNPNTGVEDTKEIKMDILLRNFR